MKAAERRRLRAAFRFLVGWSLASCIATAAAASDAAEGGEPSVDEKVGGEAAVPSEAPIYRPPARGKPRARVAGGVRGRNGNVPILRVLAPEHTGRTLSEQPSFFWYIDRAPPAGAALVFTLVDDTRVEPLIEAPLERPTAPGIQRIDLADYSVGLRQGVEYQWSVALILDSNRRSTDIVSIGWIDRVDVPADLSAAGPLGAHAYAEHGLWYDALTAASDRVEADPDHPLRRAPRAALLRQVGLGLAVSGAPD